MPLVIATIVLSENAKLEKLRDLWSERLALAASKDRTFKQVNPGVEPEGAFDALVALDTSPNNKSLDLLIRWYIRDQVELWEDFERTIEALTTLNDAITRRLVRDVDPNRMSVDDVFNAVAALETGEVKSAREESKDEFASILEGGEARKIFDKGGLVMIEVFTHRAAQQLGVGTRWCTTGKTGEQCDHYLRDGSLVFVYDKMTKTRYQLHYPSSQFKDVLDKGVDAGFVGILSLYGEEVAREALEASFTGPAEPPDRELEPTEEATSRKPIFASKGTNCTNKEAVRDALKRVEEGTAKVSAVVESAALAYCTEAAVDSKPSKTKALADALLEKVKAGLYTDTYGYSREIEGSPKASNAAGITLGLLKAIKRTEIAERRVALLMVAPLVCELGTNQTVASVVGGVGEAKWLKTIFPKKVTMGANLLIRLPDMSGMLRMPKDKLSAFLLEVGIRSAEYDEHQLAGLFGSQRLSRYIIAAAGSAMAQKLDLARLEQALAAAAAAEGLGPQHKNLSVLLKTASAMQIETTVLNSIDSVFSKLPTAQRNTIEKTMIKTLVEAGIGGKLTDELLASESLEKSVAEKVASISDRLAPFLTQQEDDEPDLVRKARNDKLSKLVNLFLTSGASLVTCQRFLDTVTINSRIELPEQLNLTKKSIRVYGIADRVRATIVESLAQELDMMDALDAGSTLSILVVALGDPTVLDGEGTSVLAGTVAAIEPENRFPAEIREAAKLRTKAGGWSKEAKMVLGLVE